MYKGPVTTTFLLDGRSPELCRLDLGELELCRLVFLRVETHAFRVETFGGEKNL